MGSSEVLGTIVVGAGLMGRWHARTIERSGGTIVAVVDTDMERARELAAKHRGSRATDDLAAALEMNGARVGHLCTPADSHVALAEQCLAAGCHVLAEKPLAPTATATRRLLDRAASAGLLVCPVHQFLFQRGVERARSLVGMIGPLRHLDTIACSAGAVGRSAAAHDEIVRDILPHPLSLFANLTGGPIGSIEWRALHHAPGELRAWGEIDGVSLALTVSLSGRPTRNSLRLVGEAGTVHVDLFHGYSVLERGAATPTRKALRPFALATATLRAATVNMAVRTTRWEPAYPGLRELVRGFYRAVRNGDAAPISARETIEVARARDAVMRRMNSTASVPT